VPSLLMIGHMCKSALVEKCKINTINVSLVWINVPVVCSNMI